MKRLLAWCGSLFLLMVTTLNIISCSAFQPMTPEQVKTELSKIAEDGVGYNGEFLFNFDSDGPGIDYFVDYLGDSTQTGSRIPSTFSKLVTQQFMQKVHAKSPKIFKDYPDFTLECIIVSVPRTKNDISSRFEIGYDVAYNLHPLTQIEHLYYGDGSEINNNVKEEHINLDNFIGKWMARLSECNLKKTNKDEFFNFKFEQTQYLRDPQKRLDFLTNLYHRDTQPIRIIPKQDYDALNMFGIFYIKYEDLPTKNIQDYQTQLFIKNEIKNILYVFMLRQKGRIDDGNLKTLNLIDSIDTEVKLLEYMTKNEIESDPIWSKCINTSDVPPIFTHSFKNGMLQADLKLKFKFKNFLSKEFHQERVFINFI